MNKDEALELALEALEALGTAYLIRSDAMLADKIQQAITALREELAQPENGEKCHDCGGMGYQDGIGDRCPTCNGFGQQPEQEPVAHWSDCAVHSEPAYPKGECDCGGFPPKRKPEQEPVATVTSETGNPDVTMSWWHEPALPVGTKLYTTPLKELNT